jgi:hypothetical protein
MAAFVCRFTACTRSIQLRDLAQYTQNQSDIPPMTITLAIGFQPACPTTIPGWEGPTQTCLSINKGLPNGWLFLPSQAGPMVASPVGLKPKERERLRGSLGASLPSSVESMAAGTVLAVTRRTPDRLDVDEASLAGATAAWRCKHR